MWVVPRVCLTDSSQMQENCIWDFFMRRGAQCILLLCRMLPARRQTSPIKTGIYGYLFYAVY